MYEQNYREARKDANVKPERAAAELGVSITTLLNWERGETSPDADKLVEMARLYNTSPNHLLNLG